MLLGLPTDIDFDQTSVGRRGPRSGGRSDWRRTHLVGSSRISWCHRYTNLLGARHAPRFHFCPSHRPRGQNLLRILQRIVVEVLEELVEIVGQLEVLN